MSAGAGEDESRSVRVLRLAWQRDVAELQRQLREASARADEVIKESQAESRRWLAREVRWRKELARIHAEGERALAQERTARERAERDAQILDQQLHDLRRRVEAAEERAEQAGRDSHASELSHSHAEQSLASKLRGAEDQVALLTSQVSHLQDRLQAAQDALSREQEARAEEAREHKRERQRGGQDTAALLDEAVEGVRRPLLQDLARAREEISVAQREANASAAREMSAEQRREEAQAQAEETMRRFVAASRELGSLRSERERLVAERDREAGDAARLRYELQAHKLEISSVARTVAAMAGSEGEGGGGTPWRHSDVRESSEAGGGGEQPAASRGPQHGEQLV